MGLCSAEAATLPERMPMHWARATLCSQLYPHSLRVSLSHLRRQQRGSHRPITDAAMIRAATTMDRQQSVSGPVLLREDTTENAGMVLVVSVMVRRRSGTGIVSMTDHAEGTTKRDRKTMVWSSLRFCLGSLDSFLLRVLSKVCFLTTDVFTALTRLRRSSVPY